MWYEVSHFDWALANRVKNSDAKQLEIYLVIIASQFYMDKVEGCLFWKGYYETSEREMVMTTVT